MCDYSLHAVKTRDAAVNDALSTHRFTGNTVGFQASDNTEELAVCVLPGTEIAFEQPIKYTLYDSLLGFCNRQEIQATETVVKFCRINDGQMNTHHDAIEFPDGFKVLLHSLNEGQKARVLQLPSVVVQVKSKDIATGDLTADGEERTLVKVG